MNSNELKNIIENARIAKGISQRELAKLSGISRSTLNDIINGKIKKVDVDSLKKIAETLDLSLTNLLKVAGYDEFLDYLSLDKYKNKSTKDLKEMIEKYPEEMVERAVKGMLPKGPLGRQMYRKLFVYAGSEYEQVAQKPVVLEVK